VTGAALRAARRPARPDLGDYCEAHPDVTFWADLPAGRAGPMFRAAVCVRGHRQEVSQVSEGLLADALADLDRQAAVLDAIEEEFPGWRVWRSRARRWWATRARAGLCDNDGGGRVPMTVDADTEAGLRAQLAGYAEDAR
jgi:hypothetical protein